jgi:hypothetical protein
MSLINSLNKTDLDVENPLIDGGPNHFPRYEHFQKYSPHKTYLDTHEEEASINSVFGTTSNPDVLKPDNIFKDGTSLDITNPGPANTGGPNRTNAGEHNIPSGFYTNISTNGTLQNKDGVSVVTQIHQYLPDKKYINTLSPNEKPSNA